MNNLKKMNAKLKLINYYIDFIFLLNIQLSIALKNYKKF